MKNESLAMDAQMERERDEMNAYIDSLFIDDQTDPPCLTPRITQVIAVCVARG